ncbi:MAG: hypothetical protein GEV03_18325 [Streptosporangiales bacterium]|nr:hypothetical protein [Streptosporangiales bacterium]
MAGIPPPGAPPPYGAAPLAAGEPHPQHTAPYRPYQTYRRPGRRPGRGAGVLLLAVGSVLLLLGSIGVPVGLGMADADPAPGPIRPRDVPGWQQPPRKVGTNSATLPVEELGWESSGEIAGNLTVTATGAECGVRQIVYRGGLGWRWPARHGQFCLVRVTAECSPPRGEDMADCRLPLGLQTAVTASGANVRVFNEDDGRPLDFLNEDVEGFRHGSVYLEVPSSKSSSRRASAVIPYDVPRGEAVSGLILYTGYFSRPVEVTVGR